MRLIPEARSGRSGIVASLELLVIVLLSVSSAKDSRLWQHHRQAKKNTSPSKDLSTFSTQILSYQRAKQLQKLILNKLNVSRSDPIRNQPTPSPKELPTRKESRKLTFPPVINKETRDVILALATEPYRPDTMKFRMSPYTLSHLEDMERASLFVILKLSKKMRKTLAEKRRKLSRDLQTLDNMISASCKNITMKLESATSSKSRKSKEGISLPCTKMLNRKARKKRRDRKFLRRYKSKKVKLVVRFLEEGKLKKKSRIFAGAVKVNKATRVAIRIPPGLLRNAAKSPSRTATFQILCRKCRRKVIIDKVYRSSRKKKMKAGRGREINPNRPSLSINFLKKGTRQHETSRSKRRVVEDHCSFIENRYPDNATLTQPINEHDIDCCMEKRYITFEELGYADWIIYPPGFTTALCLGSCQRLPGNAVNLRTDGVRGEGGAGQEQLHEKQKDENTISVPGKHCVALDSSHLDILYVINSTTVVYGHLTHFIDNSCGCVS